MKFLPLDIHHLNNNKQEIRKLFERSNLTEGELLPIPPAVLDTGNKLPAVTYSIFR